MQIMGIEEMVRRRQCQNPSLLHFPSVISECMRKLQELNFPNFHILLNRELYEILQKHYSKMLRLALFISGGGTTASAIITACRRSKLAISPVLVVASSSTIAGIQRVQDAGFSKKNIVVISPSKYLNKGEFGNKLLSVCERFCVDLIGQYGWLPLTPAILIKRYERKIINQHPGPLDPPRVDFGGAGMWGRRVHAAVLLFRRMTNHDLWTEATTHFVTAEFDKGQVIKRKKISITSDDTVESLQKKALEVEHKIQIEALSDLAHNCVRVLKRKSPLIKKNEKGVLKEAKGIAALLYPNG